MNLLCLIVIKLLMFEVQGAAIISAPKKCPLQRGNLLDVDLFVTSEENCLRRCNSHPKCLFYYYYTAPLKSRQPPQCFLYETCERNVSPATPDCPIGKENVIALIPFLDTETDCLSSCSKDSACAYYKYYSNRNSSQSMLCYHLKSCVPKLIKKSECPLEKNNYIDHRLFVDSEATCETICSETEDCRYFFWYPIDYSPSPLYCYLFRSCIRGGEEPKSAMILGGRHPGEYFLSGGRTVDYLMSNQVCSQTIESEEVAMAMARGGSHTEFVGDSVLVCGGRSPNGTVLGDCMAFNVTEGSWSKHSKMLEAREEGACLVVRDTMFVLGGIVDGEMTSTVELWNPTDSEWQSSPDMPEPRARFCAVPVDGRFIAVIGGELDGELLDNMKTMDVETGEWKVQAGSLKFARKDHACLNTRLDDEDGILVSGGVDADNRPLASVEFFSIQRQEWISLSDMNIPRTEHGLAVINGIPTVVGGVAADEFLATVEQFDNSNDKNLAYQREWRLGAQLLSVPRYDFGVATLPTRIVPQSVCNKV